MPNLKTRGERKPGQPIPGSACDCCSFAPFERDGIDLFGRNQQQRVVAALAQLFRDGQSRKEMAAGSPASNGNFHQCFFKSSYIRTLYDFGFSAGVVGAW